MIFSIHGGSDRQPTLGNQGMTAFQMQERRRRRSRAGDACIRSDSGRSLAGTAGESVASMGCAPRLLGRHEGKEFVMT
jgi:hypothetical protein